MEGFIFVTVQEKSAALSNQCSVSVSVMFVFDSFCFQLLYLFQGEIFSLHFFFGIIFLCITLLFMWSRKARNPRKLKFKQRVMRGWFIWVPQVWVRILLDYNCSCFSTNDFGVLLICRAPWLTDFQDISFVPNSSVYINLSSKRIKAWKMNSFWADRTVFIAL